MSIASARAAGVLAGSATVSASAGTNSGQRDSPITWTAAAIPEPDPLDALYRPWRERLLAHPGASALLMTAPIDGPQSLLLGERLLELLAEAGLAPADAARGSYLLIVYVLGAIAPRGGELGPVKPAPPEAERVAARLAAFSAVPAEVFPRTAAVSEVMAPGT